MPSPFFIVGPTAVGKTGIAVAVAERLGAEIVNADAFQIYEGLDRLTAKPSRDELRRVPHHLIGTVSLAETYSVARFAEQAWRCLDDITRRGRPAIVVGGSGMYVKALTHGLSPLPRSQPTLRAELENMEAVALMHQLCSLDPVSAARIDAKNKRRVVRAVEVCMTTGKRFSDFRQEWSSPDGSVGFTGVRLVRDRSELNARIKCRVEEMFAHGIVDEVRAVPPKELSETASRMIGWRQLRAYLDGHLDLKSCVEQIETATRQYAKRQMTWFRGEAVFASVELSEDTDPHPDHRRDIPSPGPRRDTLLERIHDGTLCLRATCTRRNLKAFTPPVPTVRKSSRQGGEMADAPDLGSGPERGKGSSPFFGMYLTRGPEGVPYHFCNPSG